MHPRRLPLSKHETPQQFVYVDKNSNIFWTMDPKCYEDSIFLEENNVDLNIFQIWKEEGLICINRQEFVLKVLGEISLNDIVLTARALYNLRM